MAVYLDASAIVKLVIAEAESASLVRYLATRPDRVSSALARTEVLRTTRRAQRNLMPRARDIMGQVLRVDVTEQVLARAAEIDPPEVRTLDAIHLAAALTLGDELEALVTYDTRMSEAARLLGIPVAAPA